MQYMIYICTAGKQVSWTSVKSSCGGKYKLKYFEYISDVGRQKICRFYWNVVNCG